MARFKSRIGNIKLISLDDVCNLIKVTSTFDKLNQPILKEEPFMVFCSKLSITRAEFNAAGNNGFKPEIMLIIDAESYDGEKLVQYYDKKYSIYKTFQRVDGFIELYCEVKASD